MEPSEHRWIICSGCKGEIGVPTYWESEKLICPGCGVEVTIPKPSKLLFRPPSQASNVQQDSIAHSQPNTSVNTPSNQTPPANIQKSKNCDSDELHKQLKSHCESALGLGFASIFLGWTVVVPICGIIVYSQADSVARKLNTPVPQIAKIGFALSIIFGGAQSFFSICSFLGIKSF